MSNIITKLAILELIVIILTISLLPITESYLPVELQEYLAKELDTFSTNIELILLTIFGFVVVLYLSAVIGLIFKKLWARKFIIVTTFIMFPLCLFIGANIDHAVTYTLDQVSVLIQGMIFSLLLFTNIYQDSILNKSLQSDNKSDT